MQTIAAGTWAELRAAYLCGGRLRSLARRAGILAASVRGLIEAISSINLIYLEKWPMKLAFWLGFASPLAAFFVIRGRRKGKRADDGG